MSGRKDLLQSPAVSITVVLMAGKGNYTGNNMKIKSLAITEKHPLKIYETLHSALISISLMLVFNTAFRLAISPVITVVYVAFFSILSVILFGRQIRQRVFFAASAAAAVMMMLFIASGGNLIRMGANAGRFIKWSYDYMAGYENLHSLFTPLLSILFSLLITLYVYYFIVVRSTFLPVLAAASIIIGIQHIYELPSEYVGFTMLLLLMIIQYMKIANGRINTVNPGKYAPLSYLSMWIVPICILSMFLAIRIPESKSPVQWRWLDSKLNRLMGIQGYTYLTEFDFSRFTSEPQAEEDEVILGGNLEPDSNVVLRVSAPRFMYLKGSSRDFYTGNSWVATDKSVIAADDPSNSVHADTLAMVEGLQQVDSSLIIVSQLFYSDKVTVKFENLQTKSIFVPAKIYDINFSLTARDYIFSNTNGILLSKKLNKKGFTYTVSVFTPKYSSDDLKNLLRKSGTASYEGFESKYTDSAYLERFLQLPGFLPERISELAVIITEGADNDYDKAKAVERFLTSNYTYTLSPGKSPPDRDFVDHFLFPLKKGYCTYFASAMTVLVRSLGIPARYVEGYMLPPASDKEKIYTVTNKLAHAWTEVYFEGYGWLPFEPTAAFNSLFYSYPPAKAENAENNPITGSYEEYLEEFLEEEYIGELPSGENRAVVFYVFIPIGIILVMALVAILFNNRRQMLRKWLFSRMTPADSITGMYHQMIKRLGALGFPMLSHETADEYLKRIASAGLKDENSKFLSEFKKTTDLFVKARYGSAGSVSEHDKYTIFRIYGNMQYFEAAQLGRLRYFFYHNLTGSI